MELQLALALSAADAEAPPALPPGLGGSAAPPGLGAPQRLAAIVRVALACRPACRPASVGDGTLRPRGD